MVALVYALKPQVTAKAAKVNRSKIKNTTILTKIDFTAGTV